MNPGPAITGGLRRYDVITLFPEMFAALTGSGITRRARDRGLYEIGFHNPRDFTTDPHRTVDDRPYGGGPGMVMLAEPLHQCLLAIRADRAEPEPVPLVLFSPIGQALNHAAVQSWADSAGAVLLCGRYEGVDQRFIDTFVDGQLSLGDFVLSGGEIPAMAFLDAVTRLQPGVLHDQDSHHFDSFNPAIDGLLDCPHYTRPEVWQGQAVPAPLLSGHHAEIARWRKAQSLALTQALRPDLLDKPKPL